MKSTNTTHLSEGTMLGLHSGALSQHKEQLARRHILACSHCQGRSARIASELGSLRHASPLDQRDLRYVVDRLVLRSELLEHEGTCALFLVLQGRTRPGIVSGILKDFVRPRTKLLALDHHLAGENWTYATTTLLLSGSQIPQIKSDLDANPLKYRSTPRWLLAETLEPTSHFTQLTFRGSQSEVVKLCGFIENAGFATSSDRRAVSGCIVAWIADLTAGSAHGSIEGMLAAPSESVAQEIHRRLTWFQKNFGGLNFEVTGEAEQSVPFSTTGEHIFN